MKSRNYVNIIWNSYFKKIEETLNQQGIWKFQTHQTHEKKNRSETPKKGPAELAPAISWAPEPLEKLGNEGMTSPIINHLKWGNVPNGLNWVALSREYGNETIHSYDRDSFPHSSLRASQISIIASSKNRQGTFSATFCLAMFWTNDARAPKRKALRDSPALSTCIEAVIIT